MDRGAATRAPTSDGRVVDEAARAHGAEAGLRSAAVEGPRAGARARDERDGGAEEHAGVRARRSEERAITASAALPPASSAAVAAAAAPGRLRDGGDAPDHCPRPPLPAWRARGARSSARGRGLRASATVSAAFTRWESPATSTITKASRRLRRRSATFSSVAEAQRRALPEGAEARVDDRPVGQGLARGVEDGLHPRRARGREDVHAPTCRAAPRGARCPSAGMCSRGGDALPARSGGRMRRASAGGCSAPRPWTRPRATWRGPRRGPCRDQLAHHAREHDAEDEAGRHGLAPLAQRPGVAGWACRLAAARACRSGSGTFRARPGERAVRRGGGPSRGLFTRSARSGTTASDGRGQLFHFAHDRARRAVEIGVGWPPRTSGWARRCALRIACSRADERRPGGWARRSWRRAGAGLRARARGG